ncbi:MAG: transglycosylase SLT domain-containing protein [Bdellovibrionales bacterium]|nr:transglycosylase SLT domain-containing protein [Bdellovibrionales bacterium]
MPVVKALSILAIGISSQALGGVKPIILDFKDPIKAPRWMYEQQDLVTADKLPRTLYSIRKSRMSYQWRKCLTLIESIWSQSAILQPWLLVEELRCVQEYINVPGGSTNRLLTTLVRVDRHSQWLATGPFSSSLQKEVIRAHMALLKKESLRSPKSAWRTIDRLQQMKRWMDEDQESELYKVMGELAKSEGKVEFAQTYLIRSLRMSESRAVRKQIEALVGEDNLQENGVPKDPMELKEEEKLISDLAMSEEEARLVARFRTSLKKGDWLAAITDGVELIRKYPGSNQSQWASTKLLQVYRSLAWKKERKWILIRRKAIQTLKKADGERILYWAKGAFGWGYYEDAFLLADQASDKLEGLKDEAEALLLTGKAANTVGKYGEAEEAYEKLIEKHSGSEESLEGYFRWGLVNFRLKKYSSAAAKFERLISITDKSGFDLRARYWLWRSLQKMDSERAETFGVKLYELYPLTYYGLRALSELSSLDKFLDSSTKVNLRHRLWLSESESRTWNRFQILLKAGWFEEAQEELRFLPSPQLPIEKVLFSRLWAKAFDHYQAVSLVYEAWNSDPKLLTSDSVALAFPMEFSDYIRNWSSKNDIDPHYMFALIKQESTYRASVSSPAGAVGLTQLMLPTAREVARQLKLKNSISRMSLTDAELNIRIGSSYLRRLLRAYNDHFPLALAAYNVGIGNMRKWLNSRDELSGLADRGSEVEDEIWIDELSWEETSHYIKAVLRNFLVYEILYGDIKEFPKVVWKPVEKPKN